MRILVICAFLVRTSIAFAAPSDGFYNNDAGSPLLELLQTARHSIDIEIYEMDDKAIRAALYDALGRGVHVRIVQEPRPVGEPCHLFETKQLSDSIECQHKKNLLQQVRAHGGQFEPFSKDTLCGVPGRSCLEHGKLAIIDGRTAMLSTGNFNSTNLCNLEEEPEVCNRDYSFVSRDRETVAALMAVFEHDLDARPYSLPKLMTWKVRQKISVSPVSLPDIVALVDSAQRSLQIQNQYLNEANLNAAILRAAARGVDVQITVSSVCSFARPSRSKDAQISRQYRLFDKANISSQFFTRGTLVRGKPGYLHAKAIVVDGLRAWLGSMNGSNDAAYLNREFGIFFDDRISVEALSAQMTRDHNDAYNETWAESLRCKNDGR